MAINCSSYQEVPLYMLMPAILIQVNSLRNNYAGGVVPALNNFTVPNMMYLEWDNDLSNMATNWAKICPLRENTHRDTDTFVSLVNTLSTKDSSQSYLDLWKTWTVGTPFHIENQNAPGKLKSNYSNKVPLSVLTNPYFQYIGCASSEYHQETKNGSTYALVLVCNFAPLEAPYDEAQQPAGLPCTACPSKSRCFSEPFAITPGKFQTYRHLCSSVSRSGTESKGKDVDKQHNTNLPLNHNGTKEPITTNSTPISPTSGDSRLEDPDKSSNRTEMKNNTTRTEPNNPYCKRTCHNGGVHTLCKYSGPTKLYREVTPLMGNELRKTILDIHNQYRNQFAGGLISRSLPLAANMREMNWNPELEKTARMWAMQCENDTDECRDSILEKGNEKPSFVSQLHHSKTWSLTMFPSFSEIFKSWTEGLNHFRPELIDSYLTPVNEHQDYSEFAQLIWADTYYVGCSMVFCHHKNASSGNMVTICNYGPGGIRDGYSIYAKGGPCTQCKKIREMSLGGMYCSREYIFLCSRAGERVRKLFKQAVVQYLVIATIHRTINSLYLHYSVVHIF